MKIRNLRRRRQAGQGLVEYALIIAGVTLISAAAVSIFGHKTSDLIGAVAMILPGAHADDNGQIVSGKLIVTTSAATTGPNTGAALDLNAIAGQANTDRIDAALGGGTNTDNAGNTNGVGNLIQESPGF